MKLWDFFDEVYEGYLSEFDMLNMVEELTDQFDNVKLKLMCNEFDFYLFMKQEEFLGSFSHEEIENKIHEIERAGKKIPVMSDKVYKPTYISDFFKSKKIDFKKKDLTEEQEKKREKYHAEFIANLEKQRKISLDVKKMFDPHGVEFFSLYRLRNILIDLKRKHTDAVYKFDDKEPQINNIMPIHWLKGEESLRQLLDSLKSARLIENREADDIIQEHFDVGDQALTKKSKPVNWLKSKVLLAYLIEELSTKPEMHEPFIDPHKKWEKTKLHFTVKGKKIVRSLVGDINQSRYPNGCEEIDAILKKIQ